MTPRAYLFGIIAVAFVVGAVPAAADAPVLLGVSKSWTAASVGAGSTKVCYVMAHPVSSMPIKAKRNPIGILISNWPARRVSTEPEIIPGYAYKEGSTVTAQIGSDKFTFFAKNEGASGSAWMKDPAEEERLIDAMKRGQQLIVTGISRRGTLTTDNYLLAGVSDALDRIRSCGT